MAYITKFENDKEKEELNKNSKNIINIINSYSV
jgi:hypothetical protein